jgi:hypothetical protein
MYGTGGLGVRVHLAPSVSSGIYEVLADGTPIEIACQTTGDSVTDPVTGVTSNIWDAVGFLAAGADDHSTGLYMSDLYATTPAVGGSTPGIPNCNA